MNIRGPVLSGMIVSSLAVALVWPVPAHAASAPTADVVAGAQRAPDMSWLAAVKPCNRYVSTGGSDSADGLQPATAWRTIGKAVRDLRAGQTACVRAGTYSEGRLRPGASGTATAPISIRSYPGDQRPVVRSTSDDSLFDFQSSSTPLGYWVVDGFDVDKQRHDGPFVRIEGDRTSSTQATPVSHVVVQNNRFRYGRAGGAVLVRNRVTDVLVRSNEISDNHRFGYWSGYGTGSAVRLRSDYADAGLPTTSTSNGVTYSYGREDAHGVSIESDSRVTGSPSVERVRVQGNRLLRNGGDGVQCIGAADSSFKPFASDAADVDLVDNRMEANVEEGADIKSCQRVSIRGSVSPADPGASGAAANKLLSSRPTDRTRDLQYPTGGGNFGGGDLIVLHYAARHVLVENTRLWDACEAIAMGRDEYAVTDVVVRRVLVFGMASRSDPGCARYSSTGAAVRIGRASRVDVYQNTFDMPADGKNAAVLVGSKLSPPPSASKPYISDIDVWNNIVVAPYWLGAVLTVGPAPDNVWTQNLRSASNLVMRSGAAAGSTGFVLSLEPSYHFDAVNLATWRAATGQDGATVEADPRFVSDPQLNDYFTTSSSPARDSALPVSEQPVGLCPGRSSNLPDRGFRESC